MATMNVSLPDPTRDWVEAQARNGRVVAIYIHGQRNFGSSRAEQYQEGLFHTFELLAANPGLARAREEFTPPVRLHRCAHRVIDTVAQDEIPIVRVLHGRQDRMAR